MAIWLHDYWRDEEQKRTQEQHGNSQPMLGHDLGGDSASGFDETTFLQSVTERVRARRSLH